MLSTVLVVGSVVLPLVVDVSMIDCVVLSVTAAVVSTSVLSSVDMFLRIASCHVPSCCLSSQGLHMALGF